MHGDFLLRNGRWYINQCLNDDQVFKRKLRVAFDVLNQLDGCPFYSKFGFNTDPHLNRRYVAFVYSHQEDEAVLVEWGKRFPFCELIIGLDRNGAMAIGSRVVVIRNDILKVRSTVH